MNSIHILKNTCYIRKFFSTLPYSGGTLFSLLKSRQKPSEKNKDLKFSKDLFETESDKCYLKLLEGNKLYVQQKTFENPDYFKTVAKTHTPKYFLIGCSDARVPTNVITKTQAGEIFIHRNVANLVQATDINCMSALQYALQYLMVEHVIVMGHTKCGAIQEANKNISFGCLDHWLQTIKDVACMHRGDLSKIPTEEEFLQTLTELTTKHQVLNLCKTSFVQKAWAEGRNVKVHGWMCDIESGIILDMKVDKQDWIKIKDSYTFNF